MHLGGCHGCASELEHGLKPDWFEHKPCHYFGQLEHGLKSNWLKHNWLEHNLLKHKSRD